jgi:putative transposase
MDVRAAKVVRNEDLETPTSFPLWLTLPTLTPGATIRVPLETTPRFRARQATPGARLLNTVQVNERRGPSGQRELVFALTHEIGAAAQDWRASYVPRCEVLTLDFGLRTLFATDQGDLLGRRFIDRLRPLDAKLTRLAAYRQSRGLKVRSPRYDRYVQQLRGTLETEIGRVFNRLVTTHAPRHLVLERLHVWSPDLSKRMNRLVSHCGRAIITAKLTDLEDRFGITHEEVQPAYSSQTCSNPACGYVDPHNRKREAFHCLLCGTRLHADVNAARTLRARRSGPPISGAATPGGGVASSTARRGKGARARGVASAIPARSKQATLDATVAACGQRQPHLRRQRWSGPTGRPGDPRKANPYFAGWWRAVISSRGEVPGAPAQGASRR